MLQQQLVSLLQYLQSPDLDFDYPIARCMNKDSRAFNVGVDRYELSVTHIQGDGPETTHKLYTVSVNGRSIFNLRAPVGPSTVWAFYPHGNDWVLETRTKSIVSGVDIAASNGFDEAFHYRFVHDTPVCVVKSDDRYRLFVEGALVEGIGYDHVLAHMCCEFTPMNPGCTTQGLAFFAYRDGHAYYVEVSVNPGITNEQ